MLWRLKEMNRVFLKNYFNDFANQHDIDKKTADEIKMALEPGKLEVNLFGGNPELHPHFLDIIPIAKKMDWKTTTTTLEKSSYMMKIFGAFFSKST
jgi:MoaA/NifB/PqqE/SkfB family radical SAM enzyme